MKYAICNELYEGWSTEDMFAHARRLGYQGVEVAPFTLHSDIRRFTDDQRASLRQQAESYGLDIVGLHWLLAKTEGLHTTSPDVNVRAETTDYLIELARLCRDLGGNVMVFGSPGQRNLTDGVSYEQGVDNFLDCVAPVVRILDELEVCLALEPLGPEEGNFLLTAASAIEIASLLNSPWVKLNLDVKAMSTEAIPIPQIIRECDQWLAHFHANDPNRRGPGMGNVDFLPILSALEEIDYSGWVSVEVFDYAPGIDRLAGESIDYLRRLEQAIGR